MKIGEIYFIRERDRLDESFSPFVKIGMVNDVSRNSEERLLDHQTGNPRDLVLHYVTQTPGPHRVERFLHQQYGPQRIRSEWFQLTDEELAVAVNTCDRMSKEAYVHIPVMNKAKELAGLESSTGKIAATDESTEWIQALSVARSALKLCQAAFDKYVYIAKNLSDQDKTEIENQGLVKSVPSPKKKFDESGFKDKYPHLVEQFLFVERRISGRFVAKTNDEELRAIDAELVELYSSFMNTCELVTNGKTPFSALFDQREILEKIAGCYQWDEAVADAYLRVICGVAEGIDGQATWKRIAREKTKINFKAIESEFPDEYNEFLTTESKTQLRIRGQAKKGVNSTN